MSAWLFTILRNHSDRNIASARREVEDADGFIRGTAYLLAGTDQSA